MKQPIITDQEKRRMKYLLLKYADEADVAPRWAEKISTAKDSSVEVRPLWSEGS
jgi:hypothetical protein